MYLIFLMLFPILIHFCLLVLDHDDKQFINYESTCKIVNLYCYIQGRKIKHVQKSQIHLIQLIQI